MPTEQAEIEIERSSGRNATDTVHSAVTVASQGLPSSTLSCESTQTPPEESSPSEATGGPSSIPPKSGGTASCGGRQIAAGCDPGAINSEPWMAVESSSRLVASYLVGRLTNSMDRLHGLILLCVPWESLGLANPAVELQQVYRKLFALAAKFPNSQGIRQTIDDRCNAWEDSFTESSFEISYWLDGNPDAEYRCGDNWTLCIARAFLAEMTQQEALAYDLGQLLDRGVRPLEFGRVCDCGLGVPQTALQTTLWLERLNVLFVQLKFPQDWAGEFVTKKARIAADSQETRRVAEIVDELDRSIRNIFSTISTAGTVNTGNVDNLSIVPAQATTQQKGKPGPKIRRDMLAAFARSHPGKSHKEIADIWNALPENKDDQVSHNVVKKALFNHPA